jgi:hypothetical protein
MEVFIARVSVHNPDKVKLGKSLEDTDFVLFTSVSTHFCQKMERKSSHGMQGNKKFASFVGSGLFGSLPINATHMKKLNYIFSHKFQYPAQNI